MVVDIDDRRIQSAVEEVDAPGLGGSWVRVAISPKNRPADVADKVFDEFGNVHLLFNNAGVGLREAQRKLRALPMSDWRWLGRQRTRCRAWDPGVRAPHA